MPQSPVHRFGLQQQQEGVGGVGGAGGGGQHQPQTSINRRFDQRTVDEHNPADTSGVFVVGASDSNNGSTNKFFGMIKEDEPRIVSPAGTPQTVADAPSSSVPGATWQRSPRLPHSYTPRGVDAPPHVLPVHQHRAPAATTYHGQQPQAQQQEQQRQQGNLANEAKTTTTATAFRNTAATAGVGVASRGGRSSSIAESVQRGYGFVNNSSSSNDYGYYDHNINSRRSGNTHQHEHETASSFCRSYSGSSLSSHSTRYCHDRNNRTGASNNNTTTTGTAVRLEFQSPSMRSLNSWYHHRYPEVHENEEDRPEDNHLFPRRRRRFPSRARLHDNNDDDEGFGMYTRSSFLMVEEPDYYREEEETQEEIEDDRLAPPLRKLVDNGSSSSSSGTDAGNVLVTAEATTVDIGDGTLLRLRGAEETWRAVANDFYAPGACTCCETTVFCIQDADYFICPGCRVISPLNDNDKVNNKRMAHGPVRGGGVGLGFTFEELSQWQREMTHTGGRALPPAGSSYRR